MKKFILPILLFMMFIPYIVNAETCDTDKISISSIAIESKSDNVEELSEATVSGKSINLDLSMSDVGDYIEYELVVKNDSNEDYELDKTGLKLNSDYIDYSFEIDDNANIVKAKSSKNVTLRVEYKTEVPEDKFESGSYSDNKTMTVQLSNGNTINVPDTFKNPNTGVQSYILIIFILLLISGSLYVLLKKKKYVKFMILIIITAIIIPMSVYALCKCEIRIESNVKIETKNKYLCFFESLPSGEPYMLPFIENVDWYNYLDLINSDTYDLIINSSTYNADRFYIGALTSKCFLEDGNEPQECYMNGSYSSEFDYNENQWGGYSKSDILLDSTKVCYAYID